MIHIDGKKGEVSIAGTDKEIMSELCAVIELLCEESGASLQGVVARLYMDLIENHQLWKEAGD